MTANNSRFHLFVVLLLLLGVLTVSRKGHAAPIDDTLKVDAIEEGWKTRISYPKVPDYSDDSVCELWVEDGWLHARRLCFDEVVWQVVLAKVEAGVVPKIKRFEKDGSRPADPSIHISYADGRYFIRDNSRVLRTLRQQPAEERATFAAEDVFPKSNAAQSFKGWAGEEGRHITGRNCDKWFCVMSGPTQEKMDCFVRLNRQELMRDQSNGLFPGAMGFAPMRDGLFTAYHGVNMASDDGELLIAHYKVPGLARKQLNQKKNREDF